MPRLTGVVCRISNNMYEICTKFGKLNDCLRAEDLEKFHGVVDFDFQAIQNKISLREAARMFGNRKKDKKDIEVSCNCNGECKDRRCSCFF